jgi:hypothetical protein
VRIGRVESIAQRGRRVASAVQVETVQDSPLLVLAALSNAAGFDERKRAVRPDIQDKC